MYVYAGSGQSFTHIRTQFVSRATMATTAGTAVIAGTAGIAVTAVANV